MNNEFIVKIKSNDLMGTIQQLKVANEILGKVPEYLIISEDYFARLNLETQGMRIYTTESGNSYQRLETIFNLKIINVLGNEILMMGF